MTSLVPPNSPSLSSSNRSQCPSSSLRSQCQLFHYCELGSWYLHSFTGSCLTQPQFWMNRVYYLKAYSWVSKYGNLGLFPCYVQQFDPSSQGALSGNSLSLLIIQTGGLSCLLFPPWALTPNLFCNSSMQGEWELSRMFAEHAGSLLPPHSDSDSLGTILKIFLFQKRRGRERLKH